RLVLPSDGRATAEMQLPPLPPGGYAARVVVGAAPATRHDFGCEAGGRAWADSRPNNALLAAMAESGGGSSVPAAEVASLPQPSTTRVTASRRASPWLPPWLWALVASLSVGTHWLVRRQAGLT